MARNGGYVRKWTVFLAAAVLLALVAMWVGAGRHEIPVIGAGQIDRDAVDVDLVEYPTVPRMGTDISLASFGQTNDLVPMVVKISESRVIINVFNLSEIGDAAATDLVGADRKTGT